MTTLYFVQADTLPQIKLTLTNEDSGTVKDLTSCLVTLHAKPATGSGVRFSRAASNYNIAEGTCIIAWQDGDLNRAPGTYTAEIEIFNTSTQKRETIYDTITLIIREDIGDIIAPPTVPTPVLPPTTSPPIGPDPAPY